VGRRFCRSPSLHCDLLRRLPPIPYTRLSFFYFAYYLALGGFTPYFAPYLETQGFSGWQIGVVMSLWYSARVLAPPVWGAITGRAASPVRWLRFGCVAVLAGCAGFVLPLGFLGVLMVMAVYASFYSALMPQFEAITLAHLGTHPSQYSRIRVWGSLGFLLANLAYGWLLARWGYAALIYLLLPAFFLILAAAWLNEDPPAHSKEPASRGFWETIQPHLADPGLRRFLLAAWLMQLAHGPFYVLLSLHLAANGYTPAVVGLLWATGVLAEIAMFLWLPRWLPRVDLRVLMRICFAAGAVRWAATASAADLLIVIVLAQCLHALTFAAFHGAGMQVLSEHFPGRSGVHGQALLYGCSWGLGGVLGALGAGSLWELGGGLAAFGAAALVSLLGGLVLLGGTVRPRWTA
jgi:PPP family 3-phenylpropionic acid transporter